MIKSIGFFNFRVLKETTLPLGPVTVIVGPNGSGKSTALLGFRALGNPKGFSYRRLATVGMDGPTDSKVEIAVWWRDPPDTTTSVRWGPGGVEGPRHSNLQGSVQGDAASALEARLKAIRVVLLDARAIAEHVQLEPHMELAENGQGLAGVLDRLRDHEPERFGALNEELGRLLPEFDQVLFDTPQQGRRGIVLRTREGHHRIGAPDLSQGTLFALTLLTLAHLPVPPPLVALEEPDRGIHPRLLRDLQAMVYRLAYPEDHGENRAPVQVIMTTHSPYFLDLFRDHPEEIVLAEKKGLLAHFVPLIERPDIDEILADAPLGEVWYSGVLGGVPSAP